MDSLCTNPALGLRAIRLCLQNPSLFMPQLRAILRTSSYGKVRMMIPMLTNLHEIKLLLRMVEEARRQLDAVGQSYDRHMPIGGMIEVPAAAIQAHMFCPHLDFLSIGTNDLIQYLLAIDRIDDEVNYLYDPLHPAVIQLIAHVIQSGQAGNTPVAMCGEMAGNPLYTRLLVGLGLSEFSMHPNTLPAVKSIIQDAGYAELQQQVKNLLACTDHESYYRLLETLELDNNYYH